MASRDEIIRLLLRAEGGPDVARLEKQIDGLGESGKAAAGELDSLLSELGNNQVLQRAIDQYRDLGRQFVDYQKQVRAGQEDISRLANAQRAASSAVEGQRTALAEAKEELARLTDSNARYIDTEQSRARATEQARLKVDILSRSVKEAEQAQRGYTRELDAARGGVQRAAAAQERLRPTLESLRGTLREAGLSSTQLGAAQAELGKRSEAAVSGIHALSKGLTDQRVAAEAAAAAEQGAARLAAEAAAERAAAERAAADAAQASADRLAAAHQRLGTRPFVDIAREIQDVRQAYQRLADSGTLSEQALGQANARMVERIRELQGETNGWSAALERVKGSVIAAGAGLVGVTRVLKSSAAAASDFSTRIAQINTLLDDDSGIPKVTADVRALAAEFGGNAATQAQAFYDVLSAGYEDAADAAVILDTSNKLAIGGVTDLGTATTGLVSVLKAYGLEASSAQRVADAYFIAAKGGATSVKELAESVGQVAPQAAIAKIPVETLTAAIGALTNGGVKTADAVTQVSSILQAVIKPTDEAAATAKALGIEFSLAAVRSQGLQGFLQSVATATQGNEEALARLMGRVEGLRGALSLTGPLAGDFANILGQMEGAAGATQVAFDKLRDTPAAKMARFQASLEGVQIALGGVVTAGAPVLDSLAALASGFTALPEGVQKSILALVSMVAVLAPLGAIAKSMQASWLLLAATAKGPLVAAIGVVTGVLRGLLTVISALPGSIAIKIALVGAAAAAAGADALADAIYRASEAGKAAEATQAGFRREIEEGADRMRAAAANLQAFASVQVLTAQQAATLSEAERDAYETRLAGLQKYLQASVYALEAQKRLGDLTAEESAQLATLKDRLAAAKSGHEALAVGAQAAADAMANKITPAAQLMMRGLEGVGTTGKKTSEELKKVFEGLNLRDVTRMGDVALAIEAIGEKSATAGAVVRESLADELKKLSGEDLLRFQSAAQAAFVEVGRSGEQAAVVLDSTLAAALDLLKVDAARTGVAFTESGKQAIAAFEAIAQNAQASAGQIQAAFTSALGLVKTREEAEALERTLKSASDAGRLGLAAVDESGRALQRRLREIAATVAPLADEFAALGIKSQRELEAARDTAREAFDAISRGAREGSAAQEDVQRAFMAYAETARAVVAESDDWKKQQVEASLAVQAAAVGVRDALAQAGESGEDAGEKTSQAFGGAKDAIDQTSGAASRLRGAAKDAADGVDEVDESASSATKNLGKAADEIEGIVLLSAKQNAEMREALELFKAGSISAAEYAERVRDALTDVDEELQRQTEAFRRFQDQLDDVNSQIAQMQGDDESTEVLRHERRMRDIQNEADLSFDQQRKLIEAEKRLHELKLENLRAQRREAEGGSGTAGSGLGGGSSSGGQLRGGGASPDSARGTPQESSGSARPSASVIVNAVLLTGDRNALEKLARDIKKETDRIDSRSR